MARRQSIRDIKERKIEHKRRKKRTKRAVFLILEIVIFLLLLGTAYAMLKYDKFQIHTFEDGELHVNEGFEKEGYTTLAVFGGDSRDGVLEEGTHSDTIIIVSINDETKEIKMVSIYRDTLTEQVDGSLKKANNAYFVGGPKGAINMLNKNFDLDIEGYVSVDFRSLAETVDLLGGIEIEVSEEEANEMNRHLNETSRVVGKKTNTVTAGKQVLDGVQAVTYSRIRKNVGEDFARTDRQREVIGQVMSKAKNTNLSTLNSIIDEVFSKVSTSLTMKDMIRIASGISKYHLGETSGFPFEFANGRADGAGSVIVPLGLVENVQELHAFLYNDTNYSVSNTVNELAVTVQNATGYSRADYTP